MFGGTIRNSLTSISPTHGHALPLTRFSPPSSSRDTLPPAGTGDARAALAAAGGTMPLPTLPGDEASALLPARNEFGPLPPEDADVAAATGMLSAAVARGGPCTWP